MAGLYIHVPFCARRCVYCDFYSNTDRSLIAPYIEALIREMELRKNYLNGEAIETIYLGGGTPSLLRESDLDRLFKAIDRLYGLRNAKEITIEGNPDDLRPDYVAQLRRLPINRVSMGIQSFHDDDLRLLNRRHSARQAIEAVENCVKAGLENISIDLIYGLPGQTPERWAKNLDMAIGLQVPHLSAYHLTYEKGTALDRMREAGQITPIDEETSLILFGQLIDRLEEAGYEHYEISNFARPNHYSRHNSAYWRGIPYIGLGPSAHSYDKKSRQWNIDSIGSYIKAIQAGQLPFEREELSLRDRYDDYVITRTRTRWGLNPSEILILFGQAYHDYFMRQATKAQTRGLLEINDGNFRLTRAGIFISDSVMVGLLSE